MSFEGFESESFIKASEKFKKYGDLGVTDKDHEAIGSTPSEILKNNPDKTMGDIMNEDELLRWLNENQQVFENNKDDKLVERSLMQFKQRFLASINYLTEINKLPKDFEQKIF